MGYGPSVYLAVHLKHTEPAGNCPGRQTATRKDQP